MAAHRKSKYDDSVNLYYSGMSIQDCANFYGVTRQAMHAALKIRGCKFRSNLKYGDDNHFHRGGKPNGVKRSNHLIEKAIKRGVIVQGIRCEECNKTHIFKNGRNGIEGHHKDYNKPLDVNWLCKKCHHEWHETNKAVPLK